MDTISNNGVQNSHLKKVVTGLIILASALILFLLVLGTALPGSSVYNFKVNVVEEGMESFYFTPKAKANYQIKLLERRLAETVKLQSKDTVAEDVVQRLTEEISNRAQSLITLLAAQEGAGLTRDESLLITHKLQVVLRAIEEVSERGETLLILSEVVEDKRREVATIFDDRVTQFVAHEDTEKVKAFLNKYLEDLLKYVEDDQMSEDARRSVERAVDRAILSIVDTNIAKAIEIVGEALQTLQLEEYIGLKEEIVIEETASEIENDINNPISFTLEDVVSVSALWIDPDPQMADEEYTLYSIVLKDGVTIEVRASGFTTVEMRNEQFADVGYTGDVQALIDLAPVN